MSDGTTCGSESPLGHIVPGNGEVSAVPARETESGPPVVPPARRPVGPSAEPIIIAESDAMRRAVDLARRFAPRDFPVLIVGPTGTGKEVIAQAIHRWSGRRKPLVALDCGAMPAGLGAAMLFGHRRGAFTTAVESVPGMLEQTAGGTLFLDELASLSLEGQAALLRVLETGEVRRYGEVAARRVSFRLIGAVNGEVSALVASGCFRGDLYHRLAAGVITLPALRDRPEDVWPLAEHFARLERRTLAPGSRRVIERYPWPGNARELGHVIGRAASLEQGNLLCAAVLAEAIELGRLARPVEVGRRIGRAPRPPEERIQLENTCRLYRGRVPLIAMALGVSRATLYRRLASHGLLVETFREEIAPARRLTVS